MILLDQTVVYRWSESRKIGMLQVTVWLGALEKDTSCGNKEKSFQEEGATNCLQLAPQHWINRAHYLLKIFHLWKKTVESWLVVFQQIHYWVRSEHYELFNLKNGCGNRIVQFSGKTRNIPGCDSDRLWSVEQGKLSASNVWYSLNTFWYDIDFVLFGRYLMRSRSPFITFSYPQSAHVNSHASVPPWHSSPWTTDSFLLVFYDYL